MPNPLEFTNMALLMVKSISEICPDDLEIQVSSLSYSHALGVKVGLIAVGVPRDSETEFAGVAAQAFTLEAALERLHHELLSQSQVRKVALER